MTEAFIKLHISIFLAGMTGILGKLIELPEGPLVWYRMLLTAVMLAAYLRLRGGLPRVPLKEVLKISGVGALIALHWIFFYGSVKYANVSIAVVCFALTGFFTAIFEPLIGRRRVHPRELFFSLITVCGIVLIFHFDAQFRTGIVLGVLCAAFAALFTIFLKQVGRNHASTTMLLWQMIGGFGFLSLAAPGYLALFPGVALAPSAADWLYLVLLSSFCTIGMFLLQIQALRKISAFTVNLSFNLEPIYSIILAMILFDEAAELGTAFFVGLGLICASVALQSMAVARQRGGVQ